MENKVVNAEKDDQKKENPSQSLCRNIDISDDTSLPKTLVTTLINVNPNSMLILNLKRSETSESCIQVSRFQSILGINNRIPKHIVSVDEKYLRCCLESIYISASTYLGSSDKRVFSTILSSPETRSTSAFDLAKFIVECPLASTGNAVISQEGDWNLGSITRSKSMINILKSPLFHQFGVLDSDLKFGTTNLIDFTRSPGNLSISSQRKLEKEKAVLGNRSYVSEPLHRRFVSELTTNPTFLDQTSSSSSANIAHWAMIQCTWKAGLPSYVFSVDELREVYVANLYKTKSPEDNIFDYIYEFKKDINVHDKDSCLVGKMRVRTTIALCPNSAEIMETEFVLFGYTENFTEEKQTSSKKKKGLSKKVTEVFKTSHSSKKRRSPSKFGEKYGLPENSSREPCEDLCNDLSETHFPPNFELAAIVAKDHICNNIQEEEIGGWGMKFLKKVGIAKPDTSLEASMSSQRHLRKTGGSSTSVDVLVPAGFHGGPRTRNGGPSSIIERWRCDGRCDCGGWDIGCPLTVLNARLSRKEDASQEDVQGQCKSFDMYIKGGSEQGAPLMKMVNIHDDLYFVHFPSTLSALQSFSIAVAIIHTQTPILRPKLYRS